MRITLVISGMSCGGAERVMSYLANHLAESGHDVSLITVRADPVFYPLDSRIKVGISDIVTPEGAPGYTSLWNSIRRIIWLRSGILKSEPDLIISFTEVANVLALAATLGTHIPIIVSERTYPPSHHINKVYAKMRRILYPVAKAVVVQTERAAEWTSGWLKPDSVHVIPNPIKDISKDGDSAPEITLPEGHLAVSMGRLSHEKGFDMLIDAFARAAGSNPDWHLLILGEGPLRGELESQADSCGIADRLLLPGEVKNVAGVLNCCDMYVLPSRYEGFPNALCEAMACGLPAVCFDCASGPGEIISSGENGILVPPEDIEDMADAVQLLMDSPEERARLGEKARNVIETYSLEKVMKMWDSLIES